MATRARRLKVFQTRIGFHDSVVAAPSQAAALRAWGIHQNLFADGRAAVSEDPAAVAAALANPEIPLRRAVGSTATFAVEPTSLPKVPSGGRTPKAIKPEPTLPECPPPDRGPLIAAELALRKLDDARKREEAVLRQQQADLDTARMAAQQAYVDRRKVATASVVEARKDYRKAGGRD